MLDLLKTTKRKKKLHIFNFVLRFPSIWQQFFSQHRKKNDFFFHSFSSHLFYSFTCALSTDSFFHTFSIHINIIILLSPKLFKCSEANSFKMVLNCNVVNNFDSIEVISGQRKRAAAKWNAIQAYKIPNGKWNLFNRIL